MTDPNSLLTRLRRRLARVIAPGPAAGEAWCVDCALNHGRTLIILAELSQVHLRLHAAANPSGYVSMQTAWPGRTRS